MPQNAGINRASCVEDRANVANAGKSNAKEGLKQRGTREIHGTTHGDAEEVFLSGLSRTFAVHGSCLPSWRVVFRGLSGSRARTFRLRRQSSLQSILVSRQGDEYPLEMPRGKRDRIVFRIRYGLRGRPTRYISISQPHRRAAEDAFYVPKRR